MSLLGPRCEQLGCGVIFRQVCKSVPQSDWRMLMRGFFAGSCLVWRNKTLNLNIGLPFSSPAKKVLCYLTDTFSLQTCPLCNQLSWFEPTDALCKVLPWHWNPCFPNPLQRKDSWCWFGAIWAHWRLKMQNWSSKLCLPYKIRAMAAERRLLKKPCSKLVIFHFVHVFLPQGAFPGESVPDPGRVVVM